MEFTSNAKAIERKLSNFWKKLLSSWHGISSTLTMQMSSPLLPWQLHCSVRLMFRILVINYNPIQTYLFPQLRWDSAEQILTVVRFELWRVLHITQYWWLQLKEHWAAKHLSLPLIEDGCTRNQRDSVAIHNVQRVNCLNTGLSLSLFHRISLPSTWTPTATVEWTWQDSEF